MDIVGHALRAVGLERDLPPSPRRHGGRVLSIRHEGRCRGKGRRKGGRFCFGSE